MLKAGDIVRVIEVTSTRVLVETWQDGMPLNGTLHQIVPLEQDANSFGPELEVHKLDQK